MRSLGLLFSLVALPACGSLLGLGGFSTETVDGANAGDDGPTDTNTTPADATACFGTLTRICFAPLPADTVNLAGTINTDTDPRCRAISQSGGPELCVIAGSSVVIGDTTAVGTRPLVVIATDTLAVTGTLDVSSRAGTLGAGASAAPCSITENGGTSSGGAGGGFGAKGGAGGLGQNAGPIGASSALGISTIRAGCAGGAGGNGDQGTGSGAAGAPGGAVALIAGTSVSVTGSVFASGGGGGGGNFQNGKRGAGGGGGSGGLIVLDAPTISVTGIVAANGAGGGGGADAGQGSTGANGTTTSYNVAAAGGVAEGGTHGGPGGAGAALGHVALAGSAPPTYGGGGGGGGGDGIVWIHGALSGTKISPAASQH